jgi:hypothetical protein
MLDSSEEFPVRILRRRGAASLGGEVRDIKVRRSG